MKLKRFVVLSIVATLMIIGLLLASSELVDINFPDSPPEVCRWIFTFTVMTWAWPLGLYGLVTHKDPSSPLCWWLLLIAGGLFWGVLGEFVCKKVLRQN